jgi:hypothetical protein
MYKYMYVCYVACINYKINNCNYTDVVIKVAIIYTGM